LKQVCVRTSRHRGGNLRSPLALRWFSGNLAKCTCPGEANVRFLADACTDLDVS
jgi:hypothetical protein